MTICVACKKPVPGGLGSARFCSMACKRGGWGNMVDGLEKVISRCRSEALSDEDTAIEVMLWARSQIGKKRYEE